MSCKAKGWDVSHSPEACCGQQVVFVSAVRTPDPTTWVSVYLFHQLPAYFSGKSCSWDETSGLQGKHQWGRWVKFLLGSAEKWSRFMQHAVSWKSIAYEKGHAGCEELEAGKLRSVSEGQWSLWIDVQGLDQHQFDHLASFCSHAIHICFIHQL